MIISPRVVSVFFVLLLLALGGATLLFVFYKKLYSRLSVRIAVLILASGLITLIMAVVFDELNRDTELSRWLRLLQISLLILGGPAVLGTLAALFVRRPLQQFNNTMTALEKSDYKAQLQPTGIQEFDEVFAKFNSLIRRLHREERLRKDLVSDTSHELNTPLTIMIGQLTAMQEGKHTMTKERVSIVKEQAERLSELVQQLDAYTKARIPDAGEPEDIQLRQFCQQLLKQFGTELKQQGIRTELHMADELIIRANHNALQKILANLIQNTLRYSEATELTITATPHQLMFSDNGKGVPAESLPYLFERFYRVDKSRNRTTGGLGLGLAIVKELAEQQGWEVHARPAQPGVSFVLILN